MFVSLIYLRMQKLFMSYPSGKAFHLEIFQTFLPLQNFKWASTAPEYQSRSYLSYVNHTTVISFVIFAKTSFPSLCNTSFVFIPLFTK